MYSQVVISLKDSDVASVALLTNRIERILARTATVEIPVLLRWVTLWNSLAVADELFLPGAHRVVREALELRSPEWTPVQEKEFFLGLLATQLENTDTEESSTRRILDGLYLINDDAIRARALVEAADLIRGADDRLNLNPVVQQAIAIVPALGDATESTILNMRLSDLSRTLDRTRDVRNLRELSIRTSEGGVLIQPRLLEDLDRVIGIAVEQGDRPGAEVIIQNVAPVSVRALGFAYLGRASARWDARLSYDQYYRRALETASSVDDPVVRARTVATIVRDRLFLEPTWSAANAVAELLGSVTLGSFDPPARIDVLADLFAGYYFRDVPDQTVRLRGLIRNTDELYLIRLAAAEHLLDADAFVPARALLGQVDRIPLGEPGSLFSPAYRVARGWLALQEYDRAVVLLADATPLESARILSRIPADFTFNPIAADALQRLFGE